MYNGICRRRNKVGFLSKIKSATTIMNGTIKKKIEDRMFGFIAREGESKDLFFHKDDLEGVTFEELKEGDAVTFDVVQGEKGPAAKKVTRV